MGKLRVCKASYEAFTEKLDAGLINDDTLYFCDNGLLFRGDNFISPNLLSLSTGTSPAGLYIDVSDRSLGIFPVSEGAIAELENANLDVSSWFIKSKEDTLTGTFTIDPSASFINASQQNILSVSADKTLKIGADPFATVILSPLTCNLATTLNTTLEVRGTTTLAGATSSNDIRLTAGKLYVNHSGEILTAGSGTTLIGYNIGASGYTYGQAGDTLFGSGATNCVLRSSTKDDLIHTSADGRFTIYTSGNCDYSTIGAAPESHTHKDTQITWDGNVTGDVSPIDAACSSIHNANRLAFAYPSGMTVEYSNDSGSTWKSYSVSDYAKIMIMSGLDYSLYLGNKSDSKSSAADKLRITLNAANLQVYTKAKKLLIYYATIGASGSTVTVEHQSFASAWTTLGTYSIGGDAGWNSIPLDIMFGSYSSSTTLTDRVKAIRLTFSTTGTSRSPGANVLGLLLLGTTYWTTPSNMARTGHLYSYDSSEWMILPSGIYSETTGDLGTDGYSFGDLYLSGAIHGDSSQLLWNILSFSDLMIASADSSSEYFLLGNEDIGSMYHHWFNDFTFSLPVVFEQGHSESSDIRKKDVKGELDLKTCYDMLNKCHEVIYTLKNDSKEQVGMIAQEVEESFPELVTEDKDGYKSLLYSRLSVVCLKILKDISDRLEKLENTINNN